MPAQTCVIDVFFALAPAELPDNVVRDHKRNVSFLGRAYAKIDLIVFCTVYQIGK